MAQFIMEVLGISILAFILISVLLFRKRIANWVTDIMTGGDSSKYEDKTVDELIEKIDDRLREVVG